VDSAIPLFSIDSSDEAECQLRDEGYPGEASACDSAARARNERRLHVGHMKAALASEALGRHGVRLVVRLTNPSTAKLFL
jgi:hypothetical protein